MSRYTWTPSGQDEGNIVGSRFADQVAARLGLSGFSASAQRDIAILELLAGTPEVVLPQAFGAKGDGVADDTAAIQDLFDSFGDTTTMRFGAPFFNGIFHITDTLTITKKALYLLGAGIGSSARGQGTVFLWDGPAGVPMLKLNQCWFAGVEGIRFMGKSTAKPSAAIEINSATGDSPTNTQLAFRDIWIGHMSGFDSDAANQFTSGIITSGVNVQSDQSLMDHVFVQGVDDYCIRLANTQNVLWRMSNMVLNGGSTAKGISSAARHLVLMNVFFQSNGVDIELTSDAYVDIYNMGSEASARLAQAAAGGKVRIRGGYYQSSSNTAADDFVIDIAGGGLVRLEDFQFTRAGSYAGSGEKCRMRGASCVFIGSDVTLPTGHTPSAFLDLATAVGDKRRIEWQGKDSGNFIDQWVHGDSPTFERTHVDSLAVRVNSPAALAAGNNNDYAPGNYATLRLSADAAGSTLTGISGGTPGRRLRIINVSANSLVLAHQDANSTAANRLLSPTGVNITLGQDDVADLEYDNAAATLRWRIVNVLG